MRGMARRKAQSGSSCLLAETRRRLSARPMRIILVRYRASRHLSALRSFRATEAHVICGVSSNGSATGRAFRCRRESVASSDPRRLATLRDDAAGRSASSWQGLLVDPGGAPVAARVLVYVNEPAGAAPRPASHDASRRAPLKWTRWMQCNRGLWGGDKRPANTSTRHGRARPGHPRFRQRGTFRIASTIFIVSTLTRVTRFSRSMTSSL
jgi:hypothetical protein